MNNFDPKYSTLPNPAPEQDPERDAESMRERERILGLTPTTPEPIKVEEEVKESFFNKIKLKESDED